MDKDGFIIAVVALWRENYGMNLDSCAFQELVCKYRLMSESPATKEDCDTDWGQDYEIELGDPVLHSHPDLLALMKERITEARG